MAKQVTDVQRKALRLRLGGASYQQIADALHLATRTTALRAVQAALRNQEERLSVDERDAFDLAGLEEARRAIWPEVLAGNFSAIDRYMKILDHRRKILGRDVPIEDEPTEEPVEVTVVVPGVSEFEQRLANWRARTESEPLGEAESS